MQLGQVVWRANSHACRPRPRHDPQPVRPRRTPPPTLSSSLRSFRATASVTASTRFTLSAAPQGRRLRSVRRSAETESQAEAGADDAVTTSAAATTSAAPTPRPATPNLSKTAKNVAQTFAPRASGATGKNPAVPGTILYDIFFWQAGYDLSL